MNFQIDKEEIDRLVRILLFVSKTLDKENEDDVAEARRTVEQFLKEDQDEFPGRTD